MTAPPASVARWVDEVTQWCAPAAVRWCDGSPEERADLCRLLVERGTLIPLARPDSFLARSHPGDVARVEARTVICSATAQDAGPTNRWADPDLTRADLRARFRGSMAGRTLYVLPFAMGPIGAAATRYGVQLTDSPYVALSMAVMTRLGTAALDRLHHDPFVPCWHSLGAPLAPGQADVPWPCDPERTCIAHFPDQPAIWSYGSGYGGNALLGKKCLALRIGSVLAQREGWMAEHMLLLALTSPEGRTWHLAGAFPSACGKTNLAMLAPTLPGWTVRCIGDDIAWLRIGADGRLRAINPEAGFFGVAPWTSLASNPHGMATIAHGAIFTNTALTADRDVWWEGMTAQPPAGLTDWQGRAWTPGTPGVGPAAHPNARYTVPVTNCPILDPAWHDGEGVPIDAILFGGRRMGTIPLVNEALSWEHGVFLGSTCASETTAAAEGATGVVRHDPFAMLPFCGYHMGDYFAHWLEMGARLDAAKRPRVYYVNWFRKGSDGRWLWPGFGDNARVLAWIAGRLAGSTSARRTAVGNLPAVDGSDAIDTSGLSLAPGAMAQLTAVDVAGWTREIASVRAFYATLGNRLPAALARELDQLQSRLAATAKAG